MCRSWTVAGWAIVTMDYSNYVYKLTVAGWTIVTMDYSNYVYKLDSSRMGHCNYGL